MEKSKFHLTGVIKLLAGAFFLIVIAIIAITLISYSKRKVGVPQIPKEIVQQKIEKKEKIINVEAEGQKEKYEIKADKHYFGEDNLYHLEGNVEIILFKKREGKDIFICGDEIIYDSDKTHFHLRGNARIKFDELNFEASELEYNTEDEVFLSDKGVHFSSQRLSGSAQNAVYSLKKEGLKLWGNLELQVLPKFKNALPIKAQGNNFEYFRKRKAGILQGDVHFSHGKSSSAADYMEFLLSEDEEQVKTIMLKGRAKAFLMKEEDEAEKRTIEAEEIRVDSYPGKPQIRSIEAKGNCLFKSISSSENQTQVEAEAIKFELSPEGDLAEFQAKTRVRMTEQREKPEDWRKIEGDILAIEGSKDILSVKGDRQERARIVSKDSEIITGDFTLSLENNNLEAKNGVEVRLMPEESQRARVGFFSGGEAVLITAREMRYFKDKNRFDFMKNIKISQEEEALLADDSISFDSIKLEAKGSVKVSLKPREGQDESTRFFLQGQPVFIAAKEMIYDKEQKQFIFQNDVKVWQQKKTLFTSRIVLYKETGSFLCSQGVRSVIPYKEESQEEERVEISAAQMSFRPEEDLISYEKECFLKVKDISLKANSVSVHLSREKGEMEMITAHGAVVIKKGQYEGQGEEAKYDLTQKSIILTGNPVLIDKDKGKSEGDKLTFHIGDDRITVENKGRERSITVIKS